jgi:peptidoglycan biosynthesis protein MviN/MurJ (putative lipid II flippase)
VLVAGVVGSSGSTRRVASSALTGTAVAMVAALLLVPPLGLVGAGAASLAGSVTATLVLIGSEPRLLRPRSAVVMGAAVAGTVALFVVATTAMSASFPFRVLVAAVIVAIAIGIGMLLDRTGRGDPP